MLNLAAKLTRGEKLPESEITAEPFNVLYQSAEDGLADTIKPRLIDANADVSRVMVIDETDIELSMTDHHLEAAIQPTGAKLVILGAFGYHLLFEGKSQYILTYIPLMIPTAAYGISAILNGKYLRIKKFISNLNSIPASKKQNAAPTQQ